MKIYIDVRLNRGALGAALGVVVVFWVMLLSFQLYDRGAMAGVNTISNWFIAALASAFAALFVMLPAPTSPPQTRTSNSDHALDPEQRIQQLLKVLDDRWAKRPRSG